MTNHAARSGKFELTFFGGTDVRYRRRHKTLEAAQAEAEKVLAKMEQRAAHPAVIYHDDARQPVATVN